MLVAPPVDRTGTCCTVRIGSSEMSDYWRSICSRNDPGALPVAAPESLSGDAVKKQY